MTDRFDTRVAVVGAGIAGLAAALELRHLGLECRVLEAGAAPGGVIGTEVREGYRFERGPNAMLVRAPALAFVRRHGLGSLLVRAGPEGGTRFLFRDGVLCRVPSSPWQALRSPLLSRRGKLRVLAEPFVRAGDPTGESVAAFVRRRLGSETLERLVAPFLLGVYAGDVEQLGVEAVFPSLAGYERARGSIVRGALHARGGARGLPGSHSGVGGLGGLVAGICERIGGGIELGTRVRALVREGGGWRLERETGDPVRAEAVVLAVSAAAAASLLRPHEAEAAELLDGIVYAPLVSVALGVDPERSAFPLRGFGFLVPEDAKLALLGALFMSRVFPGRAPPGRELVMAMIGGVRSPGIATAPDDVVLAQVAEGLEATLGLREPGRALAVQRWPRAVPQPGTDHPRRVLRVRECVARQPALTLAGAYLDGVSVGDALASGVRAATHTAGRLRRGEPQADD